MATKKKTATTTRTKRASKSDATSVRHDKWREQRAQKLMRIEEDAAIGRLANELALRKVAHQIETNKSCSSVVIKLHEQFALVVFAVAEQGRELCYRVSVCEAGLTVRTIATSLENVDDVAHVVQTRLAQNAAWLEMQAREQPHFVALLDKRRADPDSQHVEAVDAYLSDAEEHSEEGKHFSAGMLYSMAFDAMCKIKNDATRSATLKRIDVALEKMAARAGEIGN